MIPAHRLAKSLAGRMVIPFAVSLIIVFGVLVLLLGHVIRNQGLRELSGRFVLLAETLAGTAELPLLARDTEVLQALLDGARDPELTAAVIVDENGKVLARSPWGASGQDADAPPGAGPPLMIEASIFTESGAGGQEESLFALGAESRLPKTRIGTVHLHLSTVQTLRRTRRLQAATAVAGAALLLTCIGIGFALVHRVSAPLRRLMEATRKVSAGDLSARVLPASTEEIRDLGEAFNRMTEDLERARSELLAERTQLQQVQQSLMHAEKITALGELVAGVAHEVNNPLSTIVGFTQLLLARDLPPDISRRLEVISSEAERAAKIVRNLLTFARKRPAEKRSLGLNGLIEKTLELRVYQLQSNQISVEKDLVPDLPLTLIDFHQMQQVLLNLINNAEQALRERGRGGTIRVATRCLGSRLEARVQDDGPGIPREIQSRIFEPFFTTKKEGKGTGLGLSVCYGIVQEHGGTIRVESEPGKGSTFVIELPLVEEGADPVPPAPSPSSTALPSLRILVVDDEPGIVSFLVELLTSRGHRVDTASDVPEATRKIESGDHELIISDVKMPHGSGIDIYEAAARKSSELARRVIFITGDVSNTDVQSLTLEKGSAIVTKPFHLAEIEGTIAQVIRT